MKSMLRFSAILFLSFNGLAFAATSTQTTSDMPSGSQAIMTDSLSVDSIATDSIPIDPLAPQRELAQNARENYAALKQSATATVGSQFYSDVYDCYQMQLRVLQECAEIENAIPEAKTAILDIYPQMAKAVVFFSNNQNSKMAGECARAVVDIPLMPEFSGRAFAQNELYPKIVYMAASSSFNSKDYKNAVKYFREYLTTGDLDHKQTIYSFLAQALINQQLYGEALDVLNEAIQLYPSNEAMTNMGVVCCQELCDYESMPKYLNRALNLRPNDEALLIAQGNMYEQLSEFQKALSVFLQLQEKKPNSLELAKHVARNYYNLGVQNYNRASLEQDEKRARRYQIQANDFFEAAAPALEELLAAEPNSTKLMRSLAITYNCLERTDDFMAMNKRLEDIGGEAIAANYVPDFVADAPKQAPARQSTAKSNTNGEKYNAFAREYIESRFKQWSQKDPYETAGEYEARVNKETSDAKIKELNKAAQDEFIRKHTRNIRFNDCKLRPYDADNESFLVETDYGELVVKVPRENNEAKVFEQSWAGTQFKEPRFYVWNDELRLASVTLVTPIGKAYTYNSDQAAQYSEIEVNVNYDDIINNALAVNGNSSSAAKKQRISSQKLNVGKIVSDVDVDIPETGASNPNYLAFIIANENYTEVSEVTGALSDGEIFAEYCRKTLGIPDENIELVKNATYGKLLSTVRKLKSLSESTDGNVDVIFYYAGHGIPNESSKDAFLLPIDANGLQTEGCYSLNRLYTELGTMKARTVMVFLDACFSGAQRNEGGAMLASARGVVLTAREEEPRGNMVVFSAATGNQTALPLKDQNHGMFTYYLLKKLKETKGNVNLKDLTDYVTKNVKFQSIRINDKEQTPTVRPSGGMVNSWQKLKLRK